MEFKTPGGNDPARVSLSRHRNADSYRKKRFPYIPLRAQAIFNFVPLALGRLEGFAGTLQLFVGCPE